MYVKKNPCIESYVGFHLVLLFLTEPWSENLSKRKNPMPFVFSPSSATVQLPYTTVSSVYLGRVRCINLSGSAGFLF